MRVALRDDDTCYFTAPELLERGYGEMWEHVPVCLATVPFAVGYPRKGIPEEHWYSGRAFPLELNGRLVELLRDLIKKRRVTIALHGYTHQDYPEGYEFEAAADLERRVKEGRSYLEALLEVKISLFVPPHNALSRRGLKAVSAAGFNILGSFLSFRPSRRPWEWRTLPNWWRVQRFRRVTGKTRRDPLIYPRILRYRRHGEFGCHLLLPGTTLGELMRGFEEARVFGGDFCLATHHWELDASMADTLAQFLHYASRFPDVSFVAADDLFR